MWLMQGNWATANLLRTRNELLKYSLVLPLECTSSVSYLSIRAKPYRTLAKAYQHCGHHGRLYPVSRILTIALLIIPPATPFNYGSWIIVKYIPLVVTLTFSFMFNFMIKRRSRGWWERYNYV